MYEVEEEYLHHKLGMIDAVIIVYDCCYRDSFDNIDNGFVATYFSSQTDNIIIVANKKDRLKEAMLEATNDVLNFNIAMNWASTLGYRCIETSAKSGENIQELFKMVAEALLDKNKVADSVDLIGSKVQKFMYIQLLKY